jgi:hypothetical protein
METITNKVILKTHRFVFNEDVCDALSEFSKIHQYDDRKTFKEEWKEWVETTEINELLMDEVNRLKNNGFEGDVMDKMFKSARYYYRKKKNEKTETPRKEYEKICSSILREMDAHILSQINNTAKIQLDGELLSKISPADSFTNYLQENKQIILADAKQSSEKVSKKDIEEAVKKYKKIYKNRFYKIRIVMNN